MKVIYSQKKETAMPRNIKTFFLVFVVFAVLFTAVMVLLAAGAFQENLQRGNTIGNNGNFGITVNTGDEIYYSSTGIWRYNAGGKDDKLSNDEAIYLNYHDGLIYYSNLSDKGRLYRIRTDGTGKEALNDMRTESIDIVGDTVYYATTVLGGEEETPAIGIYRLGPEGEPTKIITANAEHISILGDNIYFVDKGNGYKLCYIKKDGTGLTVVTDEFTLAYDVADDWIYCANRESIYKMRKDGSSKTLLSNTGATSIIVVGDSVYYNYLSVIEQEDGSPSAFMSMQTDGTGAKKLLNSGLLAVNYFDSNNLLFATYTSVPALIKYDIATGSLKELKQD